MATMLTLHAARGPRLPARRSANLDGVLVVVLFAAQTLAAALGVVDALAAGGNGTPIVVAAHVHTAP